MSGVDGADSRSSALSESGLNAFDSAAEYAVAISLKFAPSRSGHSTEWIVASSSTDARSLPPLRGNSRLPSDDCWNGVRHSSAYAANIEDATSRTSCFFGAPLGVFGRGCTS